MSTEKGTLSINSENILPIIKKWLYSDTDIFVRELVSNACDAITKLKKLIQIGQAKELAENEKFFVNVTIDKENNVIMISDNGIGMTDDEIKQYINQIAFSGASDFIQKYSDKLEKDNEIIGHFGLGFYSAFMVANTVEIDTLSFKDDAKACNWKCDGGIDFEISSSNRQSRGTTIVLHLNDDGKDFLDEYKFKNILTKYCGFMPVEIFFEFIDKKSEEEKSEIVQDEVQEKKPINEPNPLWLKSPNDCNEDMYKEFYKNVFFDFNEPLFWIHLNMDYPFNLKGILYFPKLKHELESVEGQVKLYNNQVFIADNIKEVVPEFLLLLKGIIDFSDLPLNVSRSFLQNDKNVAQMSSYISRKVGDKLNSLFKSDRDKYNKYWDDISIFIKYGCIKDKNFYEKIKESIVFKTINNEYITIKEYFEKNKEKTQNKIYYVTNEQQQSQYIKLFKEEKIDAVLLTNNLDNPFISHIENYDRDYSFNRIDSDISESLKDTQIADQNKATQEDKDKLGELFKKVLKNDKLEIQIENLKSPDVPAIVLLSEQARRMNEMSKMFGGMAGGFEKASETLVLNKNNNLIKSILDNAINEEKFELICEHIYDLAMISHKQLDVNEMTAFINRSNKLLELVSKK